MLQTLKGATIFASDLVRAIHPVPDGLELGFVRASSYGAGTKSSGKVVLGISTLRDEDIQGRHILLVRIFLVILYLLSYTATQKPVTMAISCYRPLLPLPTMSGVGRAPLGARWLRQDDNRPPTHGRMLLFHSKCSLFKGSQSL